MKHDHENDQNHVKQLASLPNVDFKKDDLKKKHGRNKNSLPPPPPLPENQDGNGKSTI